MSAQDAVQSNNFLGAPIKVLTTLGEELEGELFCYDVNGSNSLILRQQLPDGSTNYKWIRSSAIREVRACGPPPSGTVHEELPPVDLKSKSD
mmetsp:Transcript_53460/g.137922  ORF Transcript_53460/g.137922 Transcript_53460/m.137922 type:complete len:92 (-) Transcript_53460:204-479(-)